MASGYVAGSPITQNQRLTEIKTATDGAYVRSYRLGYADEGSGTSRRSRSL